MGRELMRQMGAGVLALLALAPAAGLPAGVVGGHRGAQQEDCEKLPPVLLQLLGSRCNHGPSLEPRALPGGSTPVVPGTEDREGVCGCQVRGGLCSEGMSAPWQGGSGAHGLLSGQRRAHSALLGVFL